jgi:putative oligomerization/nucleic acid binding protein/phospholipase D-like protein
MPSVPFAAFTFGDGLLTVVEFAFLFLWIWIAVGVVFDIFRSHDLSNWSKALWVLVIFLFPLLGVLGYLIIRGHSMHEHQAEDQRRFAAFRQYQRSGAASTPVDDLRTLADLRERGLLTDDEFERAKAKALE